ncbi:diguanylate cyclase [Candidatus Poribacteria bacterium]|nr:diguanylate cyclase [Candidatus Poribacteria bacterium]
MAPEYKINEEMLTKWYQSIIFNLLFGIILIISISLFFVNKWISTSQTNHFIKQTQIAAQQKNEFIKIALEKEMLKGIGLNNIRPLMNALALDSAIDKIMLINLEGIVRHSSQTDLIGYKFNKEKDTGCAICHSRKNLDQNELTIQTLDQKGNQVIRTTLFFKNDPPCQTCHGTDKKAIAMLLIDSNFFETQKMITLIETKLRTGMIIISLVIIFIIIIFLNITFTQPLVKLLDGIKELGKGNLLYSIPVKGTNEISRISNIFNKMIADLNKFIEEIKQKNTEINSLYFIVEQLSKTMNIEELRTIIINIFLKMFNIDEVYILMYTFSRNEIEIVSGSPGKIQEKRIVNIEKGFNCDEIIKGMSQDDFDDFNKGNLAVTKITSDNSHMFVPLSVENEPPFGFVFVTKQKQKKFLENEKRTIIAISNHISVAVINARLFTQSITDDLTKVYRKNYFLARANEQIQRYLRYNEYFSIMMIDIDKFKEINDAYGHIIGDILLKKVAKILQSKTRNTDICGRYGGDEFVILLSKASIDQAAIIAEKLRQEILITEIPVDTQDIKIKFTLSIGISACPEHGDEINDLIVQADKALYRSKQDGRNRITCAEK